MADFVGMEIETVKVLGRRMQSEAWHIRSSVVGDIDRLVDSLPHLWLGPDAARFRNDWTGRYRAQVIEVADELNDMGQRVLNDARDQEVASSGRVRSASGLAAMSGYARTGEWREDGQNALISSLAATGSENQIGRDEIEIRRLPNGRYVVILPGVTDLTDGLKRGGGAMDEWLRTSRYGSVRDMGNAIPTALSPGSADPYSEQVKRALQAAGVPSGSEVMLVGHSYGGYAAMHLAADASFNSPVQGKTYSVNVTDVASFGAGTAHYLNDVPDRTNAIVVGHGQDLVYSSERRLDAPQTLVNLGVGGGTHHVVEFNTNPLSMLVGAGHDPTYYEEFLNSDRFDGQTSAFIDGVGSRYAGMGESIIVSVPSHGDPQVRER